MAYLNGKKVLMPIQLYAESEIEDGSITTAKLADGAVTEDKLSSEVQAKLNGGSGDTKTIIDVGKWTIGRTIGANGAVSANSASATTSYIPVVTGLKRGGSLADGDGTALTASICQYNGTTFISRTFFNELDTEFVFDDNCTQFRCGFSYMVSTGKIMAQSVIDDYFELYTISSSDDREIADGAVTTAKIADGAVTEAKLSADVKEKLNEINVKHEIFDINNANTSRLTIRPSDDSFGGDTSSQPVRSVILSILPNTTYTIKCEKLSTKRVGTSTVTPAVNGAINVVYRMPSPSNDDMTITSGANDNYMLIHLFADGEDTDISLYLPTLSVTYTTNLIDDLIDKFNLFGNSRIYHSEDIGGIHILDNFTDVTVTDAAMASSAAFHDFANALVTASNGYLTRTRMGADDWGNDLYYYKTNPKILQYNGDRNFGSPVYPIQNGTAIRPLRVILTSNIHANEKNGNFAVYNILNEIITNRTSEFSNFLYSNVEIIWIPCCCPTGTYENQAGQNVNRSFPSTIDGSCTCTEASLMKNVFDEYADGALLHLDIHTYQGYGTSQYFGTWLFTDDKTLGIKGTRAGYDVLQKYKAKYTGVAEFGKEAGGFINMDTTSSNYIQKVYGVPAGTIEARELNADLTETDYHQKNSAVSLLYDLVLHTVIAMCK